MAVPRAHTDTSASRSSRTLSPRWRTDYSSPTTPALLQHSHPSPTPAQLLQPSQRSPPPQPPPTHPLPGHLRRARRRSARGPPRSHAAVLRPRRGAPLPLGAALPSPLRARPRHRPHRRRCRRRRRVRLPRPRARAADDGELDDVRQRQELRRRASSSSLSPPRPNRTRLPTGGSNHLLVPTGLLQTALAEQSSAAAAPAWLSDAFGGGLVRIDATNSSVRLPIGGVWTAPLLTPSHCEQVRLALARGAERTGGLR